MLIISIVLVSGCLTQEYPYQVDYEGYQLHFRADLEEAANVYVYPNEQAVRDLLIGPKAVTTFIAFYPNDTENAFYTAAAYELAYKMTIINKVVWGRPFPIDTIPINGTLEIIPTAEQPVVILHGPSRSKETKIVVDGYKINVYGKDFYEGRDYIDLDLAVDKVLLILMEQENIM